MAEALKNSISYVGIDIGKNSFHVVGLDGRGAIVGGDAIVLHVRDVALGPI
jgi:photosystem II stability/assembly factor-like uncharacterized protein